MTSGKLKGSASISLEQPVYIESAAAIAGKKEGDGPLGNLFDMVSKDPLFGTQTWEAAESTLQKETAGLAIGKAGLTPRDIRMAFAGDLLAQTIASSFGIAEMDIPFYGLYGACSTMGEACLLYTSPSVLSVAAIRYPIRGTVTTTLGTQFFTDTLIFSDAVASGSMATPVFVCLSTLTRL